MRASYPRAISWLALNDDCAWLDDETQSLSVAACLVIDLWDKPARIVASDLRRERQRLGHG